YQRPFEVRRILPKLASLSSEKATRRLEILKQVSHLRYPSTAGHEVRRRQRMRTLRIHRRERKGFFTKMKHGAHSYFNTTRA
ncbi:hypothetical protein KZO83_12870, partial [Chromohalobacter sp. TMW 2.2308]|uniref:hypothetical protein n=1 Tax=Chromohalobacter TaxID=42054 RepID=UPI001FFD6617